MPKLLILTALPMEARAIMRALGRKSRGPFPASFPAHTPPVEVHTIGIGATRLSKLPKTDITGVLMAGLAGALDPSLRIGDVVIDSATENLPLGLRLPSSARRGLIHTSNRLVSTPADKASLFQRTGALAVDMEQAMARDFAASINVPFIGIRAISDTADQMLDPIVLRLMNPDGSLKIPTILAALLRRPSLIAYLQRLGANSNLALRNLGAAVAEISVTSGLEGPPTRGAMATPQ